MEFKKGDRVVCIHNPRDNCRLLNKVGTVVSTTSYSVGVAFDEDVAGHTLSGKCVTGHGWYLEPHMVNLLDTKPTFNIGDKVQCIRPYFNDKVCGKYGTVVALDADMIGVAFNEDIDGHTLGRRCERGCGWWLPKECITPATCNNYKVVITIEGNTTIAKFYCGDECVEQEIAKCNPSDKFDPLVGAQIALQRIVGAHDSKFVINQDMFDTNVELI